MGSIPGTPYYPASKLPESFSNPLPHRFLSTENHPESPLIGDRSASDEPIESAFKRLNLAPGFGPNVPSSSLYGYPATFDAVQSAEPVPSPMGYGERQQALTWVQSQSDNGGVNGPYGFIGPYQNINVGPEEIGSSGRGPYFDAGDYYYTMLMKYNNQRQDLFDLFYANNYNYDYLSFLHRKKSSLRKSYNRGNFASSSSSASSSSRPSVNSSQHLNQWQQQLTLENMRGSIVSLANHNGFLNLKLENGLTEQEIDEIILPEVVEGLTDLMTSQIGSKFVCKLFDACNEDQRTRVIMALTQFPVQIISICFNSYGAKAMVKLLEKLSTPQQISLVVSALTVATTDLVNDTHGQDVVKYCLDNFPGEYNKPLFIEIAKNCLAIASNKNGCRVIQSFIEISRGEAKERLIREVVAVALHLADDPYGNYVVQYVIDLGIQEVAAELVRQLQGHFVSFSINKYGSNVVEKLMKSAGEKQSAKIIKELLMSPDASKLLFDPFGNYVIQTAFKESKGQVLAALISLIQVNASFMRSNLYGKKLLAWIEKWHSIFMH